jgi:two-component system, NarL family, response regulator DegU
MKPGIEVAQQTEPDTQIGVLTYPFQLRQKGWRQGMKILVSCSHKLVGQSLSLILGDFAADMPVECEVIEVAYAIARARAWQPDLIVVEAITDFAQGIATTRSLREQVPDSAMVLLGADGDDATIYEAVSAGADGYLTRDDSAEVLRKRLTGVLRGEVGLARTEALRVIRQLRRVVAEQAAEKPIEVDAKLTPRESEVFELVRKGMRSREIAAELFIAEGTVYKHIHNILEKLNVHSRNQALVITLQDHKTEPSASNDA